VLKEPPLRLAAIAGDVVHNLRASLDYIVEELVKSSGHTPMFQHQFPICADADGFAAALKKGKLNGVPAKPLRLIKGCQPYQVEPEARPVHPVIQLHRLSNRDKHHVLAISALNAAFRSKFVGKDGRVLRSEESTDYVFDGACWRNPRLSLSSTESQRGWNSS
jgi:hypothetical protein